MANGTAIKDVTNKLQELNGEEVIPISSGTDEPEVVEVDTLKEYINEDVDTALEGKQDVINDLAAIRSGAALGATAVQIESDPTVYEWAKAAQKPSYSASEVGAVPTTRKINNKALSSDITLTAADVNALPSSTVIPAAQIQSDWNQSSTSAKDYIKNKPEIPDVSEWAMSSTKPSYTVSEIDGAQAALESGVNIKTVNNQSLLGSGNITVEGGDGDVNVIESITFNGSAVPVDSSKNAAITYTAPVASVNGNTGAITLSASDVGALPDTTSIPTESTVSGWGFTKNTGTVTSVSMNGSTYTPTSGVVDLGTVITSHQSLSDYVQKSQTSGLLKNDGTVDTTAYTTNTGTVTSTGGTVAVNNIQVVSALPASPDANTLYLIPES